MEAQHRGDGFVREPERRIITGISRTGWWMLEREGKAPRRRKLRKGGRAVGWLRSDLRRWVEATAAGLELDWGEHQEPAA